MRRSALLAHRGAGGAQVLVVHRPVAFTLDAAAHAMHAAVDPSLARNGSRQRVGRTCVRAALRQIVSDGWPPHFTPDPQRVAFWRRWLLDQAVFSDDSNR